jgi:Flp pilus assembly protein TadG
VKSLLRPRPGPRPLDEPGAVAVELALLVPALLLVLGLLMAGGRLWFARTTVVEAAQTAARAGSLARSSAEAGSAGRTAGRQSLATAGLGCAFTSVSVSTAAFSVPVGAPATVTSDIVCRVSFSDLLLPFIPGSIQLTGRGSAALDTYRSR